MKIKWYGHAAFLITSDQGIKMITDPYEPGAFGGQLSYGRITDQPDVVSVSHDHDDHNYTKDFGSAEVIRGAGSRVAKGIPIKGTSVFHDPSKGSERGINTIFTFTIDGIRVCHLGDLGHALTEKELAEIGPVDLLLTPVGGFFTIDATEAALIVEGLKPRVVIPMHFKTQKCGFPIAPVDDFLRGKAGVKRLDASEASFDKTSLPQQTEVMVFSHAL